MNGLNVGHCGSPDFILMKCAKVNANGEAIDSADYMGTLGQARMTG